MKILNCVYKLLYGIFLIGAIWVTLKNVFCVYRIGYFQLFDFLPVYGAKAYWQVISFSFGIYCCIFFWIPALALVLQIIYRMKRRRHDF